MNGVMHIPVTYHVTPEEKDAFVADKLCNGYLIGKINWVAELALFSISVTYVGYDLAD